MNPQEVEDELQYIELNYEFSDEAHIDLQNYMLRNNLVKYYDDTLMITPQGELLVGYSKAELKERYGDEDDDELYNEVSEGEDHYE